MVGPQLPFSQELHAEKYRGVGETFEGAMDRVASALSDNSQHYFAYREILHDQRFLPAGRVQAAMGSAKNVTAYNCFVSGTIGDSFVDGPGSIMDRLKEAATTMRMGGGIGYDFSTLRPRGAMIKKLHSKSSGPLPFMDIYSATCLATSSAGNRRGAQMGVLSVNHPDIEEFIHAKQNETRLRGFNLSIAVTDAFMSAVMLGNPHRLTFNGEDYGEIDARSLWDEIMRSTWDWAEPGVLFIDRINAMNNLWYCETIAATNPCGEQPLPPFGACLLGSYNLVKYIRGEEGERYFDFDQLKADIPAVIRAQDNIVDRSSYPLPEQKDEAKSKRRMGIGVAGMANAIEAMGHAYGSQSYLAIQDMILRTINVGCYEASVNLAKEKGAFPLFDKERYAQGQFIRQLPTSLQSDIFAYGIRNSHLTSIAPTGTISLSADNISSGLEPVFSYGFPRTVIMNDGTRVEEVTDYGFREFGVKGKTANEVTVDEHIEVLTRAQRFVDSAISKTCNVPGTVSWEDFKQLYVKAWKGGAKGCTTFRTDGKRAGIFGEGKPVEEAAPQCRLDPVTGRKECD